MPNLVVIWRLNMKHLILFVVAFLSFTLGSSAEGQYWKKIWALIASSYLIINYFSIECGPGAVWEAVGHSCKYRCTPDGVTVDCSQNGCQCINFEHYYNLDTKSCSEVNCENLSCVGHKNEQFFKGCQSSSRENCVESFIMTADCRQGCMCKDGYCRKNGKCVKRTHWLTKLF